MTTTTDTHWIIQSRFEDHGFWTTLAYLCKTEADGFDALQRLRENAHPKGYAYRLVKKTIITETVDEQ